MINAFTLISEFLNAEKTKTGVQEYEGMEVDDSEAGPGPQRCKDPYLSQRIL